MSKRLSRLASRLFSVDLFDLKPLVPFTWEGLTNALLAIGFVSLSSLFRIETGTGIVATPLGTVTLFFAAAAPVMPVRGVRQRIRQAKENKLEWIDGELSAPRETLRESREGRRVGEIADLAAHRSLVDRTPEWPFTTSAYVRFALCLLIPLGLWAAGAVVERMVERFFCDALRPRTAERSRDLRTHLGYYGRLVPSVVELHSQRWCPGLGRQS